MNKTWLIAVREYITRVRKRTFILATLLTPIGVGLLMAASIYFTTKGSESAKTVLIADDSKIVNVDNLDSRVLTYSLSSENVDKLKDSYQADGYDILVHISAFDDLQKKRHQVSYYTSEKLGVSTISKIESDLAQQFKDYKLRNSNIDLNDYNNLKTTISLENGERLEQIARGEKPNSSGRLNVYIGTALGGIMGFLMYMVIFIYGGMVMRSVMEEKINRVVEIIISSVKPIQLMLGKVIGVGFVGLTQLLIWLILIPLIILIATKFVSPEVATDMAANQTAQMEQQAKMLSETNFQDVIAEIVGLNWWLILPTFILFFFAGYFIYASLFAAVGSAVGDDMGETQQLMLPLSIPVIIAFMMLQGVLANPNGTMAVFGSMFPLTSPIIMPARLAFDPPLWQVALSVVILIASCIFFAWIAGRIYRTGILLYGKKVTFKEIGKWLFYKS